MKRMMIVAALLTLPACGLLWEPKMARECEADGYPRGTADFERCMERQRAILAAAMGSAVESSRPATVYTYEYPRPW